MTCEVRAAEDQVREAGVCLPRKQSLSACLVGKFLEWSSYLPALFQSILCQRTSHGGLAHCSGDTALMQISVDLHKSNE